MKKRLLTLLIAMVPVVCLAKTTDSKIAVINIEQAILSTKEAQTRIAQLEADGEFKKNLAQLKKIQEEGQKLTEQYKKDRELMSTSDLRALEEKIKTKQADLEHVGRKLQESRNNLLKGLMIEMNEDMTRYVKQIIDAEKIGLLLPYNPQLILHADASFDITDKLTKKLDQTKKK